MAQHAYTGQIAAAALTTSDVDDASQGGPSLDCVAQISDRPQPGHLALLLREADILRTSELEHPVLCVNSNCDLGRSTPVGE